MPACLQLIAGHRQQALASILHHSLVLFCIEQTASPSYGHRQQALASMLHHSLMVFCVEQTASLIYALLRSENTRCKRRARLLCQLLLAAIVSEGRQSHTPVMITTGSHLLEIAWVQTLACCLMFCQHLQLAIPS